MALTVPYLPQMALHTKVLDWYVRVNQNSSLSPASWISNRILSNFLNSMDEAGLSSLMYNVNCIIPDFGGVKVVEVPLTHTLGQTIWGNTGIVNANVTINGVNGGASSRRFDTGVNLSSSLPPASQSLVGFTWYAYSATTTGFDLGAYNLTNGFLGAAKHSDGKSYAYNGIVASNVISLASPGPGYYSSNRISSTDHRLYFATGSSHAQIGSTDTLPFTGAMSNLSCWVCAENFNGSQQFSTQDILSFIAIHKGLTSAQSNTFYNIIKTMRKQIGGGYV